MRQLINSLSRSSPIWISPSLKRVYSREGLKETSGELNGIKKNKNIEINLISFGFHSLKKAWQHQIIVPYAGIFRMTKCLLLPFKMTNSDFSLVLHESQTQTKYFEYLVRLFLFPFTDCFSTYPFFAVVWIKDNFQSWNLKLICCLPWMDKVA